MADTKVDGGKLQELTTSVRVIESEMKSMREFLENRLDGVSSGNDKIVSMLGDHNKRIYQNEKDIARVATWMTIVGSVIGIAVALSYLIH